MQKEDLVMTTANKLTLLRIILIPVFLIVLYIGFPYSDWVALGIFIIASLTDMLDGYIARHYNQITDFGKFMDPLADKMLVMAAMCWLVEAGQMWGWVLAVVLMREFAVSGLRLIAVEQGRVIAAAKSGKLKTLCTMVGLCFMLVFHYPVLNYIVEAIIIITTVYSGIEYFAKNIDVFKAGAGKKNG